jgi:hypothetical protein
MAWCFYHLRQITFMETNNNNNNQQQNTQTSPNQETSQPAKQATPDTGQQNQVSGGKEHPETGHPHQEKTPVA